MLQSVPQHFLEMIPPTAGVMSRLGGEGTARESHPSYVGRGERSPRSQLEEQPQILAGRCCSVVAAMPIQTQTLLQLREENTNLI